ncbi:ABC transporter permease [Janibacter cremeus]|uniref:Transport permease protein n=1 Tax=Janibacter cremeus TaxID=1285192 RepID=A0A852VSG9_9MICO|nr:ABC transporter permease [Janibacter cremeus]NYF98380.1 ABC-2 type transport system permease protein [Janibacter cremeus]
MNHLASDSWTIVRRNLIKIKRVPDLLVFTTLQPIMFVLLFGFVFGSLAMGNADGYREFMMAGIFAQTVVFGGTYTGFGMAEDMQKGVIDRFRTLPMHPGAVLIGRTLSDVVNNVISLIVMAVTGLAIGWRVHEGIVPVTLAFLLLLLFAYAISWIMAWVGLKVRSPEIVGNASFLVIFPLTFIANTFVPAENLPAVLRTFAGWNPVSTLAHAARENFGNLDSLAGQGMTGQAAREAAEYTWALQHAEIYTLAWVLLILAIFVPLSIRTYQRTVLR